MRRTSGRPGMLVAAGIMLLVIGGCALFNVFCSIGGTVFQNALDPMLGGGGDMVLGVDPDVAKEVPSAVFVEGGVLLLNALLGAAMLFAGLGVLQRKPSARNLAFAVGAADVFVTLTHSLHNAILVFPVQDRLIAEEVGNFGDGPFNLMEAIQAGMWSGMILQVVFTVIWWGMLFFFLCHPSVRAAFDAEGEPDEPRGRDRSYPRREDFDDDDYGAPPRRPPPDTGITDRS
jgi:hypothetical protein